MIKILKNKEDKIDKGIFVVEPANGPFSRVFRTPTYYNNGANYTRITTSDATTWTIATRNTGD